MLNFNNNFIFLKYSNWRILAGLTASGISTWDTNNTNKHKYLYEIIDNQNTEANNLYYLAVFCGDKNSWLPLAIKYDLGDISYLKYFIIFLLIKYSRYWRRKRFRNNCLLL